MKKHRLDKGQKLYKTEFKNGKYIDIEFSEYERYKYFEKREKEVIGEKYDDCKNFIYNHYPQTKQNSDLADKLYYENILKANGFENLEQTIVAKVVEFENGKSFDELLSDVDDANKEAISQLLKVGIRVTWVQRCKEELKKSIAEDREPSYPAYPFLEG